MIYHVSSLDDVAEQILCLSSENRNLAHIPDGILPPLLDIWVRYQIGQYMREYPVYDQAPREGFGPSEQRPFSPMKHLCALLLLHHPPLKLQRIANDAGTSVGLLKKWRSEPKFRSFLDEARNRFVLFMVDSVEWVYLTGSEQRWTKAFEQTVANCSGTLSSEILKEIYEQYTLHKKGQPYPVSMQNIYSMGGLVDAFRRHETTGDGVPMEKRLLEMQAALALISMGVQGLPHLVSGQKKESPLLKEWRDVLMTFIKTSENSLSELQAKLFRRRGGE